MGLPIVNHLLRRLRLDTLLAEALPTTRAAARARAAGSLGLLLRNLILNAIVGRSDSLCAADSELCSRESLAYVAAQGGRFITVLPRTGREDGWFRAHVQTQTPPWHEAVRRPHARRRSSPDAVWKVVEAPLASAEGNRVIWVWSSLMAAQDANRRQARTERAWLAIEQLQTKLAGSRCRYRTHARVQAAAHALLADAGATPWVRGVVEERADPQFRQERRGRPGAHTRCVRTARSRFTVRAVTATDVVAQEARTDGMLPLLTSRR